MRMQVQLLECVSHPHLIRFLLFYNDWACNRQGPVALFDYSTIACDLRRAKVSASTELSSARTLNVCSPRAGAGPGQEAAPARPGMGTNTVAVPPLSSVGTSIPLLRKCSSSSTSSGCATRVNGMRY